MEVVHDLPPNDFGIVVCHEGNTTHLPKQPSSPHQDLADALTNRQAGKQAPEPLGVQEICEATFNCILDEQPSAPVKMKTTFNSVSELVATMNPEVITAYIDLIEKESAAKDAEIEGLKEQVEHYREASLVLSGIKDLLNEDGMGTGFVENAVKELLQSHKQNQLLLAQVARMTEALKDAESMLKAYLPEAKVSISVIEKALTPLPAEAQQLLEDKARLDWFDKHYIAFRTRVMDGDDESDDYDAAYFNLGGEETMPLCDVRLAIDSAMKGTK